MEDCASIWSIYSSRTQAVQLAAQQQLEGMGLAVPRGEPDLLQSTREETSKNGFGISLFSQPTLPYQWRRDTFSLPRIFVLLVKFLEGHVHDEGLFRKAGSVSRQRMLRAELECPTPSLPPDCNVHDVASLFKQFLRELPHPLLPAHYWPLMEACVTLVPSKDQATCLQLSALLLPSLHLQCLCVVMKLLSLVSSGAGHSLMDASSLAIVMAPNLIKTSKTVFDIHDHCLRVQRRLVKLLIEGAECLGIVPPDVELLACSVKVVTQTRSLDGMLQSRDDPLPDGYGVGHKERKLMTSSLSGLIAGLGNKLLRRKGLVASSGDCHVTEQRLTKRATKRKQDDTLEPPGKRLALEKSGEETFKAASCGSLHSSSSTDTSLTSSSSSSSSSSSPLSHDGPDPTPSAHPSPLSHDDPTPDPTPLAHPSPILYGHLRAIKLRHSKTQSGTDTLKPRPNATSHTPLLAYQHAKEPLTFSGPAPLASLCADSDDAVQASGVRSHDLLEPTPVTSRSHDLLETAPTALRYRSHDLLEAKPIPVKFMSHDLLETTPTAGMQSPNLLDKICSEMARRSYNRHVLQQGGNHSLPSYVTVDGKAEAGHVIPGSGHVIPCKEGGVQVSPGKEGSGSGHVTPGSNDAEGSCGQPDNRRQNTPRTLRRFKHPPRAAGIIAESARKQLRSRSHYSATLGMDETTLPRRKLRKCELASCDLVDSHPLLDTSPDRPSSPVVLSASLGITQIKTAGGHRPRGRGRKGRGNMRKYRSHDIATPLGTKAVPLENDVPPTSAPGPTTAETKLEPVAPTLTSAKAGKLAPLRPLNPPHSVAATGTRHPSHPQRYKSPWRWASMRGHRDYTPVKNKGAISKRAQPYMVNLPRPSSCYAGFLKEDNVAENDPPPTSRNVPTQQNINVQEWVL